MTQDLSKKVVEISKKIQINKKIIAQKALNTTPNTIKANTK